MIQTKQKTLIPFAPNPVQEAYLDQIAPGWRDGDYTITGLREQILKARQFGFSTLIGALFFVNTYNHPNTNTVVIADDLDNAQALFKMVSRFYDNLPAGKTLPTRFANRKELDWPDLNSTYQVLTAGKRQAGRSRTVHNLHMSERPFWEASDILTGLLQTVPTDGNVFDESTANGEGNQFHADYIAAQDGNSTFAARFFAWFEHHEYRAAIKPDFVLTPTETELISDYHLSPEQIQWRRNKIKEPGMGSLFVQEYPANSVEAFRVSGRKFFTEWNPSKSGLPWHVVPPFSVPKHWRHFGGLDWGYGAPFCFLLGAIDEQGGMVILDEIYASRLLNRDQAARIEQCLVEHELQKSDVIIYADPSMWNVKMQPNGVGYQDIADFQAAKLSLVKASNQRTGNPKTSGSGGWANVRQYLHDTCTDPQGGQEYAALRVIDGKAPNLCRTLPQMIHDKHNPEDMDSSLEDHSCDPLRYMQNAYIRASKSLKPASENYPHWMKDSNNEVYL